MFAAGANNGADFVSDQSERNRKILVDPRIIEALRIRHKVYNDTLEKIDKLEEEKRVFVFRPQKALAVDRFENDQTKLNEVYQQGYDETHNKMEKFKQWLTGVTSRRKSTG